MGLSAKCINMYQNMSGNRNSVLVGCNFNYCQIRMISRYIYIYSYLVRCYTNQICNSNSVYNKICVKTRHSTNITTKSLKKPTIHNSGVSANQSPSSACFLALNPRSQVRSCTSTWAEIRSLSFVNHASQSTAVKILVVIVIVIVVLMVLS